MDTICLWLGRIVLIGGALWLSASIFIYVFLGIAFASAFRKNR